MSDEPTKAVPIQRSEKSRSSSHEGGGAAAADGPAIRPTPMRPPRWPAAESSKGPHEEDEDSQTEERNLPGTQHVDKETVGLTPESVKVAIGIPSSYFEKVWRERNPATAGQEAKAARPGRLGASPHEESAKIQKHVAGLLPPAKGVTDPNELVTITTFQDIKPAEIPLPGIGQKVLVWLAQYWSTLGLIGLGLVSLVVLRSMVRAAPGAAEAAARADARGRRARAAGQQRIGRERGRPPAAAFSRQRPVAPRRTLRTGARRPRRGRQHPAVLDRTSERNAARPSA